MAGFVNDFTKRIPQSAILLQERPRRVASTCRHSGASFLKRTLMQMPSFPEIPPRGHRARVHVSVTSWCGHDRMQDSWCSTFSWYTQSARDSSVSHSVVSISLRLHDCSLPGSSVHGIFQARILEWVAIPFSRGSFWFRDQTQISCVAGRFFTCLSYRKTMCWIVKEKLFVPRSTFLLEKGVFSHSAHSLWILVWTEKWEGVYICILYAFFAFYMLFIKGTATAYVFMMAGLAFVESQSTCQGALVRRTPWLCQLKKVPQGLSHWAPQLLTFNTAWKEFRAGTGMRHSVLWEHRQNGPPDRQIFLGGSFMSPGSCLVPDGEKY